jgi:C1A family cysteine protease
MAVKMQPARHSFGWKPDPKDNRDYKYKLYLPWKELPSKVDLRSQCSPVRDQGQLGSCTAFAMATGLREWMMWRNLGGEHTLMSPLFLYWQERNLEGTVFEDSGAYIRDGLKVLQQMGTCPEKDDPYDISRFTETPTPEMVQKAFPYKIASYESIPSTSLALQTALAQGDPVVMGMLVYSSFETQEVATTGIVPMPSRCPMTDKVLGGHAVFVVGYQTDSSWNGGGYFIVKNSWSKNWGDAGFFYLPFGYISSYRTSDLWTAH